MTWVLRIDRPTPSQNTCEGQHFMTRHKDKGVWWWCIRGSRGFLTVPRATGRCRLTIERHARARSQDEALVQLGLLVDGSPAWIKHGTPRHVPLQKGEKPYTILIFEDCA